MSALEVQGLMLKIADLRKHAVQFQELYTILEKVHAKVVQAEPLVDSRSSSAYSIFTADLRRVTIALEDSLDRHLSRTSFFDSTNRRIHKLLGSLVLSSAPKRKDPIQGSQNDNADYRQLPVLLRPKIASELEEAQRDLQLLLRLFNTYLADLLPKESQERMFDDTHSRVQPQQQMAGSGTHLDKTLPRLHILRKQDIDTIWEYLKDRKTGVIAIVGMAGVGKTTLVEALCKEANKQGFDYRLHVHVSHYFDPEIIFRDVMKALSKELPHAEDPESYWWSMKEGLIDKKYLVVLDNAWNEDSHKWSQVLHFLQSKKTPGSKILVTTRIHAVADSIHSEGDEKYKHNLLPFSVEDSLKLLETAISESSLEMNCNRSFSEGSIIRKFAERCNGLPKLVYSMTTFLKEKIHKRDEVHTVEEFDKRCLGDEGLLNIAEASYKHLPSHLQRCFLYCSLFPFDHIFDAEEIIGLWIAEGLTHVSRVGAQMDGDYSKLLDECFDIIHECGTKGQMGYKMQFILHNFAQGNRKDLYKAIKIEEYPSLSDNSIRYMSVIVEQTTNELPASLVEQKELRTLILHRTQEMVFLCQRSKIREIPSDYCIHLTALRVLDLHATKINKMPHTFDMLTNLRYLNLSQTDIAELPESLDKHQYLIYLNIAQTRIKAVPESIGKIKSLRYLNLSQTCISELPETIGNLRSLKTLQLSRCKKLVKVSQNIANLTNLQKLDLEGCHYLSQMPENISRMTNLKELNILECSSLDQMPSGIRMLNKIEELPRYIVTNDTNELTSLVFQKMKNMKRLGLENIGKISKEDAENIQLNEKSRLEHLSLSFNMDAKRKGEVEVLCDILEPNRCLKTLEITSYTGEQFPSWMRNKGKKFENLVHIKLINLNCKSLIALTKLTHLTTLEISGMDAIKHVGEEVNHEQNQQGVDTIEHVGVEVNHEQNQGDVDVVEHVAEEVNHEQNQEGVDAIEPFDEEVNHEQNQEGMYAIEHGGEEVNHEQNQEGVDAIEHVGEEVNHEQNQERVDVIEPGGEEVNHEQNQEGVDTIEYVGEVNQEQNQEGVDAIEVGEEVDHEQNQEGVDAIELVGEEVNHEQNQEEVDDLDHVSKEVNHEHNQEGVHDIEHVGEEVNQEQNQEGVDAIEHVGEKVNHEQNQEGADVIEPFDEEVDHEQNQEGLDAIEHVGEEVNHEENQEGVDAIEYVGEEVNHEENQEGVDAIEYVGEEVNHEQNQETVDVIEPGGEEVNHEQNQEEVDTLEYVGEEVNQEQNQEGVDAIEHVGEEVDHEQNQEGVDAIEFVGEEVNHEQNQEEVDDIDHVSKEVNHEHNQEGVHAIEHVGEEVNQEQNQEGVESVDAIEHVGEKVNHEQNQEGVDDIEPSDEEVNHEQDQEGVDAIEHVSEEVNREQDQERVDAIEHVGEEVNHEQNPERMTFGSLKKLTFTHMFNLESWLENGAACPVLEELSIIQCPKFKSISKMLHVKKLTMWTTSHELLGKQGLIGVAGSVKSISISLYEELSSADIEGLMELSKLEELEISGCDRLGSLPVNVKKLTSLKNLSFISCSELGDLSGLQECKNLKTLHISGCPNVSIPDELEGITKRE